MSLPSTNLLALQLNHQSQTDNQPSDEFQPFYRLEIDDKFYEIAKILGNPLGNENATLKKEKPKFYRDKNEVKPKGTKVANVKKFDRVIGTENDNFQRKIIQNIKYGNRNSNLLNGYSGKIRCFDIKENFAATYDDEGLKLRDLESKEFKWTYPCKLEDRVLTRIKIDENRVIFESFDNQKPLVRILDLQTGEELTSIQHYYVNAPYIKKLKNKISAQELEKDIENLILKLEPKQVGKILKLETENFSVVAASKYIFITNKKDETTRKFELEEGFSVSTADWNKDRLACGLIIEGREEPGLCFIDLNKAEIAQTYRLKKPGKCAIDRIFLNEDKAYIHYSTGHHETCDFVKDASYPDIINRCLNSDRFWVHFDAESIFIYDKYIKDLLRPITLENQSMTCASIYKNHLIYAFFDKIKNEFDYRIINLTKGKIKLSKQTVIERGQTTIEQEKALVERERVINPQVAIEHVVSNDEWACLGYSTGEIEAVDLLNKTSFLLGKHDHIFDLAIDGGILITASKNNSADDKAKIKIWDIKAKNCIKEHAVSDLSGVAVDSGNIFIASQDRLLQLDYASPSSKIKTPKSTPRRNTTQKRNSTNSPDQSPSKIDNPLKNSLGKNVIQINEQFGLQQNIRTPKSTPRKKTTKDLKITSSLDQTPSKIHNDFKNLLKDVEVINAIEKFNSQQNIRTPKSTQRKKTTQEPEITSSPDYSPSKIGNPLKKLPKANEVQANGESNSKWDLRIPLRLDLRPDKENKICLTKKMTLNSHLSAVKAFDIDVKNNLAVTCDNDQIILWDLQTQSHKWTVQNKQGNGITNRLEIRKGYVFLASVDTQEKTFFIKAFKLETGEEMVVPNHKLTTNRIDTLDGDRQNDPADIPKLLSFTNDFDLICGQRVNRQDPWHKKITSKLANFVRSRLCRDDIHDTGCSLKVYRKTCLNHIKMYKGMHRFLPALFKIEGFRIAEVPVNHRERTKGTTKYNFFNRSFNTIADMLAVRWMSKRQLNYKIEKEIS